MTDRELLEFAAKAAGIKGQWRSLYVRSVDDIVSGWWVGPSGSSGRFWNPLTDDGDALRLAVQLAIDIRLFGSSISGWTIRDSPWVGSLVDRFGRHFKEACADDPYAATRRVIVRAAAQIGETMP